MESLNGRVQKLDVMTDHGLALRVGGMVSVERRAWPGINKPGGIGRIERVHAKQENAGKSTVTHVDVKYIVQGGRERSIPVKYVTLKPELDQEQAVETGQMVERRRNQLRDRSMLLGRCRRCGSLRTDCGSCDLMALEHQFESSTNRQASNSTESNRRSEGIHPLELHDNSSSSSSDESLMLLIQRNSGLKKYSREKMHYRRILRRIDSESSSSSSDDSNPTLSRLARPSTLGGTTRSGQTKRVKPLHPKRQKDKKHKRVLGTGHSALEHLSASGSNLSPLRPPTAAVSILSPPDSTSHSRSPTTIHSEKEPGFVGNVGDSDMSPSIHPSATVSTPQRDDLSTSTDSSGEETPFEASQSQNLLHLDDFMQPLDDFIQPEGVQVAENLPEDTKDKTKSLSYGDLPAFFDRTAKRLEERIPVIRQKSHELKQMLKQMEYTGVEEGPDMLRKIENESSELFSDSKQLLIRDGTDQCLRAIRRLRDSKQRRKHHVKMTKEQRKQCKGIALEMRDMRLENLKEEVECVMQDLRRILQDTGAAATQTQLGGDESCSSEGSTNESGAGDTQESPELTSNSFEETLVGVNDCAELSPFDPHMHASRVTARKSRKRDEDRSRASKRVRKTQTVSGRPQPTLDGNHEKSESTVRHTRRQKRNRKRRRRQAAMDKGSDQNGSDTESSSDPSLFKVDAPIDNNERIKSGDQPPSLESLLPHDDTAMNAFVGMEFDAEAVGGAGSNNYTGAPIADRMQAFLDANSSSNTIERGNAPNATSTKALGSSSRKKKSRRSKSQVSKNYNRSDSSVLQENDSDLPITGDSEEFFNAAEMTWTVETAARHLYRQMLRQSQPQPVQASLGSEPRSVAVLCSTLIENYPLHPQACWNAFDEIHQRLAIDSAESERYATQVFKSIMDVLQTHGVSTLQEIVQSHSSSNGGRTELVVHVNFLSKVLVLIEQKSNKYLKPEDGVIYKVFSSSISCPFVNMIMLQTVDVVYSQLLPAAWSSNTQRHTEVLDSLSPLRDSLGRILPLVETMARLITNELECQRWWKVQAGSRGFVSSVSPHEYESFLRTGMVPTVSSDNIRFKRMKGTLPRCEILALWSIFAYFAGAQSLGQQGTGRRWQLLLALLFSKAGVLGTEALQVSSVDSDPALAPSRDHLSSCEKEIGYLTALLLDGAMDPLPTTDGFLVKLLEKSFALQAEQYIYNCMTHKSLFPPIPTKEDFRSAMCLWDTTDLHASFSTLFVEQGSASFSLAKEYAHGQPCISASLLPTSGILRRCVSLYMSWAKRLPEKKARWSRLNGKVLELIANFEGKARMLERKRNYNEQAVTRDSFEDAFSTFSGITANGCSVHPELFYREGAVHLLISMTIAGHVFKEPCSTNSIPCAPLTRDLREKVWSVLSDDVMRERQKQILEESSVSLNEPPNTLLLYSSAKALVILTLVHMGVSSLDLDSDSFPATYKYSTNLLHGLADDENMFVFLVSCIVSCLDCACEHFCATNRQNTKTGLPHKSVESADVCARTISCICTWLARIFTRFRCILLFIKKSPTHAISILRQPIEVLRRVTIALVTKTLAKCLKNILDFPHSGTSMEICCRTCLAALRSALAFASESTSPSLRDHMDGIETYQIEPNQACTEDVVEIEETGCVGDNRPNIDFMGDLDDNAFLDIDLGIVEKTAQEPRNSEAGLPPKCSAYSYLESKESERPALNSLWTLLSWCVDISKPSKRFAILHRASGSVVGRSLAAHHAGAICACLGTVCVWDLHQSTSFRSSLDSLMRPNLGRSISGDGDHVYLNHIAQCFSCELSHLSLKFPNCMRLLNDNLGDIFGHLINALLDSDTLERFPSCNWERIGTKGGEKLEQKEHFRIELALHAARAEASASGVELPAYEKTHPDIAGQSLRRKRSKADDVPGPVYNSLNLWSFCRSLGSAISHICGEGVSSSNLAMIGKILVQSDCDLASEPSECIPQVSLERECFRRLQKLRGLISSTAHFHRIHADHPVAEAFCYERISSIVISSNAYHFLRVSKGAQYYSESFGDTHRMPGRNEKDKEKQVKLAGLQHCYAQLAVALNSWILRESDHRCSGSFNEILRFVRDPFFSQILNRHSIDIHGILQRLSSFAVPTPISDMSTASSKSFGTGSVDEQQQLLDDIYEAVVRRARELMIHAALGYSDTTEKAVHTLCIYNALMVVGTGTTGLEEISVDANSRSLIVGHAFHATPKVSSLFKVANNNADRCHLQDAIDDYFNFVDVSREFEMQEVKAIRGIRQFALTKFLLPKFIQAGTELSNKKGFIRLIRHIMDLEMTPHNESNDRDSIMLDSQIACSFAKGLCVCLRQSIEQAKVDSGVLCDLFELATLLVSLSSSSVDETVESLLYWSKCNSASASLVRLLSQRVVPSDTVFATYFWNCATWLKGIAEVLIRQGHEVDELLLRFRREALGLRRQGKSIWTHYSEAENPTLQPSLFPKSMFMAAQVVEELERTVFPDKENVAPVVNVYAKAQKSTTTESSDTPFPSIESLWVPTTDVRRVAQAFLDLFPSIE